MCVVNFAGAEQCFQGIVSGKDKTSEVDQEFAPNVKEDKEEVETDKAEESINLGNAGLLLKVIESGVFGELPWCQLA